MRRGIDKGTRKDSGKQVAEGITLLEQSGYDTACLHRAILESCGGNITVETTHGNSVESTSRQELLPSLRETSTKLKDNEKDHIDDEGPFAVPAVSCNTEQDGTDRSQHKNKGDTPSNLWDRFLKRLGHVSGRQRKCEEIECIPRPAREGDL
jgi:hypothetical protein